MGPAQALGEVYKGETYMKVKAKVYVREEPMLSVDLMDPHGNTLGAVLVRKPQSLRVLINGKLHQATRSGLRTATFIRQALCGGPR